MDTHLSRGEMSSLCGLRPSVISSVCSGSMSWPRFWPSPAPVLLLVCFLLKPCCLYPLQDQLCARWLGRCSNRSCPVQVVNLFWWQVRMYQLAGPLHLLLAQNRKNLVETWKVKGWAMQSRNITQRLIYYLMLLCYIASAYSVIINALSRVLRQNLRAYMYLELRTVSDIGGRLLIALPAFDGNFLETRRRKLILPKHEGERQPS